MILLLGGSGYIGRAFCRELDARKMDYLAPSHGQLDALEFTNLYWWIRDKKMSLVINAAGYCGTPNVDACEDNKAQTFDGNVALPVNVSRACAACNIPWIHISSGCIYSGDKNFSETDVPNFDFEYPPRSYYSGTKSLAEKLITNVGRCYVCRMRMPFDEHDHAKNLLSKLQRYEKVYEAKNSMSHRGDCVKACLDLAVAQAPFGIYNVTNPGSVTSRQIVMMIHTRLRLDREWDFFEGAGEFYSTAAKAPRSSCTLNTDKLAALGIVVRPIEEAIEDALLHWRKE